MAARRDLLTLPETPEVCSFSLCLFLFLTLPGFAVRFYTEEGNCDIVGNNTPIFFLRDPVKFSPFIHTQKRNPRTGLKDPNAHWTYVSEHNEALHQYFLLHSDRGTPASFRQMHGYGSHTYKLVQQSGEFVYVKFHFRCDLGFKTLSNAEATKLAGEDPDHAQRDLYENIDKGNFPTWTLCIQTMTPEQAERAPFSVFDLTKVWPHADYPLQPVGKLTLNEVPKNYFAEVEQAALSPSNMVPGVAPSADPVLQSRLFSYPDAHRYRLGVNYRQIPVNCPLHGFNPLLRDGAMRVDGNLGSYPTYLPSATPVQYRDVPGMEHHERWVGTATRFHWEASAEQGDFVQIQALWKVFEKTDQQVTFVNNVAGSLKDADAAIQDRVFVLFAKVTPELGQWIREETLKLSPRDSEPRRL